jgi:hypothetical protein
MLGVELDGIRGIWPAYAEGVVGQTIPVGSNRIVWMIIGMIECHPIEDRWQGKQFRRRLLLGLDPVLFSNDTRMRNAVRNSVTIFRKYGQHARRIDRLVEDANARTEVDAGCWRRGARPGQ